MDEFGNKLDDPYPDSYYVLMIFIAAFHRAVLYGQFVAIMAFFARISDPVSIWFEIPLEGYYGFG